MKGIPRDVIIADTGKQYTLCVCGPAPLFTSLCRVVKAGDVTLLLLREDNLLRQGDARVTAVLTNISFILSQIDIAA